MTAKTIRVDVTAEDIGAGTHSAFGCPVALALSRAVGVQCSVVGASGLVAPYWRRWDSDLADAPTRPLPQNVVDWVSSFDGGDFVQPFTFRVVQ